MSVVIETTVGDMTVDLFVEERPLACLNFIKLCKLKYYNYNLFHTIEQDFIAQTGDPTGAGNGGSSVWGVIEGSQKRFFEAESVPKILHSSVGLLSLVSPAKNLVGSQFFFTLAADLTSLDGQHCVIGEVVEGHETLRRLNEAIVDDKFRPYQDIRITHTVILDDPFPDMRGFRAPSRSPSPTAERLQNGRIAADEDIDDTDGKSLEEIQEMLAEREAKARATILEIVGDLPDADAAPPENVLFVCKLNPVTTESDLEIIFSRFGKVNSCEVIRDKKTGDSLQYAFVEFDDQKSCETAYFKMNNVLIDDRRIHVDFSQSVARVKWRGKGRGIEGQQGKLDFNNLRTNDERKRMTSEERREARKERHRDQQKHDIRQRRRSRERDNREHLDQRRRENSRHRESKNYRHKERMISPQNGRNEKLSRKPHRYERERSRHEQSRQSRNNARKRSTERHRSRSRSDNRQRRALENTKSAPDSKKKQRDENKLDKELKQQLLLLQKKRKSQNKKNHKKKASSDSDSSSTSSSSSSNSSSKKNSRRKNKNKR